MAGKQADDVMTIDELAAYLKLSKLSLYHFARAGKDQELFERAYAYIREYY